MKKIWLYINKYKFLLLAVLVIIVIFFLLPKSSREFFAYAIFITIIISDADMHILNKILNKLFKRKEK
ncbi:hypothetical protein, partial [Klebsiella pneumoniae]|uniref:hypothetical protein n=1 Tax=Klebsiella pneumoniae TaxID=573 RepID=UPI003B97F08E